ncbi:unnamed protein product, partial [Ectocarpus sp. 12 AP-2014]
VSERANLWEAPCPPAYLTEQERHEKAHAIMGRFAQESHTDLRDWYVQCLDFRALKRRLIDDPPDPYDDHPSMMTTGSPDNASPAATDESGTTNNGASSSSPSAVGPRGDDLSAGLDDLEQQEALLKAERGGIGAARGDGGTASGGGGGGGGSAWGRQRAADGGGGRISLAFPDPASRVFIFEINEELERMWAFYRKESDQCASTLSALHDSSASLRHKLHRKLGGMGGVPEDFSSAATAGGSGVGYEGGGSKSSAVGDGPGGSAATTASLLDDPDLQYKSSPVVSTGGVLRPTPQEHFLVAGSGAGGSAGSSGGGSSGSSSSSGNLSGATRIRGRRPSSNGMGCMASSSSQQQLQGEDENGWGSSGWGMSSSTPSGPSAGGGGGGDVDGGAAKANAGFGGGNGFMSNSAGAGDDENATTEDPYVRASLKRAIVELYDTCHRLLSFKMLNYDAFVRLMELHCRRPEVAGAPPRLPWSAGKMTAVGDNQGAKAGGAVGGEGEGALSKEKAMKVWLLEQPLFSARDLNGTLAGAELLYASLFCNGDVDVARTALTFKASSSLRGNRRFDFGYRLGAATVLLAWAMWDCIADDSLGKDVWHDPAFKIYRGLGNLVLLVYMWGVNIWVWKRFGIDYERCLSLDPKGPRVDPCEQVWNAGCNLSIAFLVSFICFYKCLRGVLLNPTWVPIQFAHTFPLLLLFYMLLCFLVSAAALT